MHAANAGTENNVLVNGPPLNHNCPTVVWTQVGLED